MVPPELRKQVDTYVQEMGVTLLDSVHQSIMNGIKELPTKLGFIVGLASVPFFLFYVPEGPEKVQRSLLQHAGLG